MKKLKKLGSLNRCICIVSFFEFAYRLRFCGKFQQRRFIYRFSLKRGGTYKTKYTLNPVDTLSSTNARAVIGDDTRVVDFSKVVW